MFTKCRKPARASRVAVLLALSAIGVALSASSAFGDVLPPGLAGEHYDTFATSGVTFEVTSRTCDPAGESRLSYVATGPAAGPYTGQFREEGTIRVGPQTSLDVEGSPFGIVTSYEATFTIDSVAPVATVTGSKSIAAFPMRDRVGWCLDRPAPPNVADQFSAQNQPMQYSAVISIGGARYSNGGSARSGIYSNINTISPIYDAAYLDAYFFTNSVGPTALDTTPPDASPQVSPAPNAAGWNTGDVTVTWNWSDAGSALDLTSGCPATSTSSGEGAAIVVTATCADTAGNSASRRVVVKVDKTAPIVTLAGVHAVYTVDEYIAFSCTSIDPGVDPSGVATATCPNAVGPAYEAGLGTHTLSASATDNAGNVGRATATFAIIVTPASLCNLTVRFVRGGMEHAAAACALASQVFAAAKPEKRAALIAAYKRTVRELASRGWLTPADADVLAVLADGLLIA